MKTTIRIACILVFLAASAALYGRGETINIYSTVCIDSTGSYYTVEYESF